MITFQLLADVKADRRVVLSLPPDVPIGKIELVVTLATAAVQQQGTTPGPGNLRDLRWQDQQVTTPVPENATSIDSAAADTQEPDLEQPEDVNLPDSEMDDAAACLVLEQNGAPQAANTTGTHPKDLPELPATGPQDPPAAVVPLEPPRPSEAAQEPEPEPAAAPAAVLRKSPPPPQAATLQLPPVLGDYRLYRKLGQGRLGTVYVAYQAQQERKVAVKVLSQEVAAHPQLLDRLVHDAHVMAKLRHRHILQAFEVGETLGHHYVAMEFMEEGSAGSWLEKLGNFSVGDSLCILLACCHGLHYAHTLNVLHGDLKPDNLFLTTKTGVKLADVGLVQHLGANFGLADSAPGVESLLFMAPEQIRAGKPVDARTDLYALGCMLYLFLTGELPFTGATLKDMVEAKERGAFEPARSLNREVPERLDEILGKLLAVEPDDRYQSCAALSLELEALGLASSSLKFLRTAPATAVPTAPTSTGTTPPPPPKAYHAHDLRGVEGYWYVPLASHDGQPVNRKVTYRQLLSLIKKKAVDGDTPASRTRNGVYHPLGSYPEFHQLSKGKAPRLTFSDHMDAAAWLHQESAPSKKMDRRRWLQSVLSLGRGRQRLLVYGGAAAGVGVALFFLSRGFWFWRLKRSITHLFH